MPLICVRLCVHQMMMSRTLGTYSTIFSCARSTQKTLFVLARHGRCRPYLCGNAPMQQLNPMQRILLSSEVICSWIPRCSCTTCTCRSTAMRRSVDTVCWTRRSCPNRGPSLRSMQSLWRSRTKSSMCFPMGHAHCCSLVALHWHVCPCCVAKDLGKASRSWTITSTRRNVLSTTSHNFQASMQMILILPAHAKHLCRTRQRTRNCEC